MFPFLFVFYCLCKATGALSQSLTDTVESSNSDTFGKLTARCSWKCVVVQTTDFVPEMKVLISNYRIVSLDLKLREYVDDSCLNQTDSYSSSRLAKVWIWSTVGTHEKNVFYPPGSDG